MCNIFGGYDKNCLQRTWMEFDHDNGADCLKMRGRDSFGVVGVHSKHGIYKDVTSNLEELEMIPTSYYIGILCRAIPEPELIEHSKSGLDHKRDTQPFYNDEWVVSHNGTIIKPDQIIKKYNLEVTSPVDSALLPALFSYFGNDPVEALKSIDGSFSIAAYRISTRSLYLMSNFQPLYYVNTPTHVYYASLPEQLEYLELPVQKVPPYTALHFMGYEKPIQKSLYRRETNKKVLIVASGGLDSVTTARLYQVLGYEVSLVHFLYAQAAESVEVKMMKEIAEKYKWPLLILDVRAVFKEAAKGSRLLNNTKPVNDSLEDAEGVPSYVGNRNMIFGSIAAGIAEENGIDRVALGLNLSDGSAYPDNCLPFLFNMEETLQTSLNQQRRVLFRSPFTNMMKHEILQVAIAIGSPLPMQASCYYPMLQENGLPKYCSGCGSHLLRRYAFQHLKIKDPVPYEEKIDWEGCKELGQDFYDRMNNVNLKLNLEEIPFYAQIARTL